MADDKGRRSYVDEARAKYIKPIVLPPVTITSGDEDANVPWYPGKGVKIQPDQALPTDPGAAYAEKMDRELQYQQEHPQAKNFPDMPQGQPEQPTEPQGPDMGGGLVGYGGGGGGGATKETAEVEVERGTPLSPRYYALQSEADRSGKGAVDAQGQALQQGAQLGAMRGAINAAHDMAAAATIDRVIKEGEAYLAGRRAKLEQAEQAYQSAGIDPERSWKNKDSVAKILSVLGVALGAFPSGFSGGKIPNFALNMLNAEAERDVDAQRAELTKMGNAVGQAHNFYSIALRETGDKVQAKQLALAERKKAIASMADSAASQIAAGPEAKSKLLALQQKLYQEAADHQMKADLHEADKYKEKLKTTVGGGRGGAGGGVGMASGGEGGPDGSWTYPQVAAMVGIKPDQVRQAIGQATDDVNKTGAKPVLKLTSDINGWLDRNPNAPGFGPISGRYVPDEVYQFKASRGDKEAAAALEGRAKLAQLETMIGHKYFGSSRTEGEAASLAKMIKSGASPQQIRTQLRALSESSEADMRSALTQSPLPVQNIVLYGNPYGRKSQPKGGEKPAAPKIDFKKQ